MRLHNYLNKDHLTTKDNIWKSFNNSYDHDGKKSSHYYDFVSQVPSDDVQTFKRLYA